MAAAYTTAASQLTAIPDASSSGDSAKSVGYTSVISEIRRVLDRSAATAAVDLALRKNYHTPYSWFRGPTE